MKEQGAYASAGSVAEEVLSSIRTVVAFGGEQNEVERSEGGGKTDTDTQTGKQTYRQAIQAGHTGGKTDTQTYGPQTNRQTDRHMDHRHRQTDIWTTDTDRQTYRPQTDRKTYMHQQMATS